MNDIVLLRLPAVLSRTGLSRSQLYRLIKTGDFERPIKLAGSKVSVWPSTIINCWIADQLNGAESASIQGTTT